jgi:hypothetical protein
MPYVLSEEPFKTGGYRKVYNSIIRGKKRVCLFACELDGSDPFQERIRGTRILDLSFYQQENLVEVQHHAHGVLGYLPDKVSFLLHPLLDDDDKNVSILTALGRLDDPLVVHIFIYAVPSYISRLRDTILPLKKQDCIKKMTIEYDFLDVDKDNDEETTLPNRGSGHVTHTTIKQGDSKRIRTEHVGGSASGTYELLGTLDTYSPSMLREDLLPINTAVKLHCNPECPPKEMTIDINNQNDKEIGFIFGCPGRIVGCMIVDGCVQCTTHSILEARNIQWVRMHIYCNPDSPKSKQRLMKELKSLVRFIPA